MAQMTEYAKQTHLKKDKRKYKTLMQIAENDEDRMAYTRIHNLIERILDYDKKKYYR